MKVEELSQYGKTLSGLPKEAIKKQKSIVFQQIKTKFGLIGLLLFLTPVNFQGAITIPFAVLAKALQNLLGDSITAIVTGIVVFTAAVTIYNLFLKTDFIEKNDFLKGLFDVSPIWLVITGLLC